MTNNLSLQISLDIKKSMSKNLLSIFHNFFPSHIANEYSSGSRDRVYSPENTAITMILSACNADKTLQNSVNIYKSIHENNQKYIESKVQEFNKELEKDTNKKLGRPRKSLGRIPKSKLQSISSDTSGFSQARQRLSKEFLQSIFEESKKYTSNKQVHKFFNRPVYFVDGTYLQMQDTPDIRNNYPINKCNGYPRALLQVITEMGTGKVISFDLSPDTKSELEVFSNIRNSIADYGILLGDDVYNCYSIYALLKSRNIDIIVPGKRKRKYTVLEKLGKGDELVRVRRTSLSKWLNPTDREIVKQFDYIDLRRIEYTNPNTGTTYVLFTTLTEPEIEKSEIILLYLSRWDIEVSIREIKTIMDINIVRSKTIAMAEKEVMASLIAYNYIRRMITESTENSAFSPERDIIYEYYTFDKSLHIDKLGRVYTKWSSGRKRRNLK